jgi:Mor family transcriptional regulator
MSILKFELPENMLPTIEELPGDLSGVAAVIEELAPGLGVKITLALVKHYRGTYIYCHNVDAIERAARNRWIKQLRDAEMTVPEIARRVGLAERQVWNITGEADIDNRQMKLF